MSSAATPTGAAGHGHGHGHADAKHHKDKDKEEDAILSVRPHGTVVEAVRSRVDSICHKLSEEGWLYKPLIYSGAYMRTGLLRHDSVLRAKDRRNPLGGLTEQEFEECRDLALLSLFSSPEAALEPCVRAGFYLLARENVTLRPNSALICPLRPPR